MPARQRCLTSARNTRETTDIEHVGLEDIRQPDILTREVQIRSASAVPAYATGTLSAANSSTAIYSITNPGHIALAWTNGLNALCCTMVITPTAFKQRQYNA